MLLLQKMFKKRGQGLLIHSIFKFYAKVLHCSLLLKGFRSTHLFPKSIRCFCNVFFFFDYLDDFSNNVWLTWGLFFDQELCIVCLIYYIGSGSQIKVESLDDDQIVQKCVEDLVDKVVNDLDGNGELLTLMKFFATLLYCT